MKGTLAMTSTVRTTAVLMVLSLFPLVVSAQSGGDAIFAFRCASCHGKDGTAKTAFGQKFPMPDLHSQAIQSQSDRDLFSSIGKGFGHKQYPHAYLMRGMTEAELSAVIRYIRTMK
jgi:mono/diheme cytochrome c family protein